MNFVSLLCVISAYMLKPNWTSIEAKSFGVTLSIFGFVMVISTILGAILMAKSYFYSECKSNNTIQWIAWVWCAINIIFSQQIIFVGVKTANYWMTYRTLPDSMSMVLMDKAPDLTDDQLFDLLTLVKSPEVT